MLPCARAAGAAHAARYFSRPSLACRRIFGFGSPHERALEDRRNPGIARQTCEHRDRHLSGALHWVALGTVNQELTYSIPLNCSKLWPLAMKISAPTKSATLNTTATLTIAMPMARRECRR